MTKHLTKKVLPVSRKKPVLMRKPGHKMHTGLLDLINKIKEDMDVTNATMVEVGSYQGESTEMFQQGGFGKIFAVDPWIDEGETTTYGVPFANVEFAFDNRTETYDNITKIKNFSVPAADEFEDESLDFVYIDALHTYDAVKADIAAWLPKVKKGGFIGGHDAAGRWGKRIRPAIEESFGKEYHKFVDTSWLIKIEE